MTDLKGADGLEINQDMEFQLRAWKVQRAGWLVIGLTLVLALLGLFGQGILSQARVGDGAVQVYYERFARLEGPTALRIEIGPGLAPGGSARLAIGRQYVQAINIQRFQPEPDRAEIGNDFVTYHFQIVDPEQVGSITLRFMPERAGLLRGWLRLNGGPVTEFRQLVYP